MYGRELEFLKKGFKVDENTDWYFLDSVIDEHRKREEKLRDRIRLEEEELLDYKSLGVPIIDESDDDFSFFIEHPQQTSKGRGRPENGRIRTPLTRQEKEEVLIKCGGVCVKCRKKEDLQIHHIDGNPSNNNIINLETVCYRCHKKVHSKKIKSESDT